MNSRTRLSFACALASIPVAWWLSACATNPAAPGPASSDIPASSASTLPGPSASPSASPDKPATSAQPAPGNLALPPGSASAWNNAQSDGHSPVIDRGLTDYKEIIEKNRAKFRTCYEKSLGAHPGIQGRVKLRWTLNPDGSVKEAALDRTGSDIVEADLETCLVAALKTIAFPASKRGMESTVTYPFTFTPKGK